MRFALGLRVTSPYTLGDMAADSVAVLDVLGIDKAHVCGASMGGMIAQRLAARYPERVKSLTLMMTSSGARRLPGPSLKVRGAMISRPKDQRLPSIVEHYVDLYGLIGSPAYPPGKDYLRERFTRSVKRSYRPAGTARQMVAIAADGDRTPLLGTLRPPTHVIHGAVDPLVPAAAGRDLGARIPGSDARRHRRHGPRPAEGALAAVRGRHRRRGRARLNPRTAIAARATAIGGRGVSGHDRGWRAMTSSSARYFGASAGSCVTYSSAPHWPYFDQSPMSL